MGKIDTKPGLNYIHLINLFWQANTVCQYNGSETKLYFGLMDKCNKLNWKNPFGESERFLSNRLGLSVNTIRHARNRLIETGLIKVTMPKKGSKSLNGQAYYLITAAKIEAVEPLQKLKQTAAKIEAQPLQKLKRTAAKIEANNKPSLNLPKNFLKQENGENDFELTFPENIKNHKSYNSFIKTWNKLLQLPNWKRKEKFQIQETLNSFAGYNPQFLVQHISIVIQSGWAAVIIKQSDYEAWCIENGVLITKYLKEEF